MKEFSAFIDFCANSFQQTMRCQVCPYGRCIHDDQTNCNLDCYSCLSKIHRNTNDKIRYQCDRIIYNYVLKHGHRYASEIDKLFQFFRKQPLPQDVNVVSIGCGPCTELFGILNQLGGDRLHFVGFDYNQIWKPLNDYEINLFPNVDIKFSNDNFLSLMGQCTYHVDVLVLNYMLSDMVRYEDAATCSSFIDGIVDLCESKRISYIIINDIYLTYSQGTGYALMEELARKLMFNKQISEECWRLHFAAPNPYQFPYGVKCPDQLSFPVIEKSVALYDPFLSCGSISMIVKLT